MFNNERGSNLSNPTYLFFLKATLVEFPLSYPTYPNIYFSGGEEEKPKGPLVVYSFVVPLNTEDKVNYKEQQAVLRKALRAHLPKGLLLETREKGGEVCLFVLCCEACHNLVHSFHKYSCSHNNI